MLDTRSLIDKIQCTGLTVAPSNGSLEFRVGRLGPELLFRFKAGAVMPTAMLVTPDDTGLSCSKSNVWMTGPRSFIGRALPAAQLACAMAIRTRPRRRWSRPIRRGTLQRMPRTMVDACVCGLDGQPIELAKP